MPFWEHGKQQKQKRPCQPNEFLVFFVFKNRKQFLKTLNKQALNVSNTNQINEKKMMYIPFIFLNTTNHKSQVINKYEKINIVFVLLIFIKKKSKYIIFFYLDKNNIISTHITKLNLLLINLVYWLLKGKRSNIFIFFIKLKNNK